MTVNQADEQSVRPGGFGRFYRPIQGPPADTDEKTSNGAGGELEYDDLDDNDWQDPDWDDGSNQPGPQFH